MKKTVAIILLLAGIFAFSACNLSDNSNESTDESPFICISDKVADKAFTLNETPFTSEQIEKINAILDTGENTYLEIDETGGLSYTNTNIETDNPSLIFITKKRAVKMSKKYLQSMDLLPSGDYDVDLLDLGVIHFRHTYDDVPIFTDDYSEGIILSFTGEGIRRLKYCWSTVTPVESESQMRITLSEAKQLYLDFMEEKYEDHPTFGVPSKVPYQQVYYCENGQSVPCYLFSDEEPLMMPVCVNAVTGDITEW